jgi:hypothetical protein
VKKSADPPKFWATYETKGMPKILVLRNKNHPKISKTNLAKFVKYHCKFGNSREFTTFSRVTALLGDSPNTPLLLIFLTEKPPLKRILTFIE